MYKFGPTQKKILIALLGGVSMGMSNSPKQCYRVLQTVKKDWEKIDQFSFDRSGMCLSREKLVKEKRMKNGYFKLVLTKEGEKEAKKLSIIGSSIKFKESKKWDKKWRIVLFDIPEKDRDFRDILRNHLRELKFFKLQHSVFVSPYPYEKNISELIDLYSARKYVRVITALKIDNEEKIIKYYFGKKAM